jgi:uncharacterized protein
LTFSYKLHILNFYIISYSGFMAHRLINVRVTAKAHKSVVEGWQGGVLICRVGAVREKGRANAELIELVAEFFSVAKSEVEIVSGAQSRNKRVQLPEI